MKMEDVLKLLDAGFTTDEIRSLMAPADPAPAPDPAPDPAPAPDPEPGPSPDPAPDPAPAPDPEPDRTPAWFAEFVKKNNEDIAQLQRALQVQNVRRAAPPEPQKTPEQLMAEAYRAIVE